VTAVTAIELRPADARDRFVLRAWIADPAAGLWTTTRAGAEAAIQMALDLPVAMPRFARSQGDDIAYLHVLDQPRAPAAPSRGDIPAGAMMIDVIVSPRTPLTPNIAATVIGAYAQEVFQATLVPALTVAVPLRLEGAVRAFEQAGFRWCRIERTSSAEPSWLMHKDRSPALTSSRRR
jgi:aminoglycoside 6'-N-acetyltransferase